MLYGICTGLVKFLGETRTSDAVITVCRFLAIVLFMVSFIIILCNNSHSPKECIKSLVKLVASTAVIYLFLSYVIGILITSAVIYVFLSIITSIIIIVIII